MASVKPQTQKCTVADLATGGARVRPGGLFAGTHATVSHLLQFAYNLKPHEISGGPAWVVQQPTEN